MTCFIEGTEKRKTDKRDTQDLNSLAEPRTQRLRWVLRAAVVLSTVLACAGNAGGAGDIGADGRIRGRGLVRRDDKVLLTRFADVLGLAVSQRMVFVATSGGLGIFDRQFDSWLPPFTAVDGFPVGRISSMAADPATDAVWIGGFGALLYYRPSLDQLVRTIVPGATDVIFFDRRDAGAGAYVRSSGTWTRVSPTGFATAINPRDLPPPGERLLSSTLAQVYAEFPSLRSFEGLLTRDARLRSWPVTSGARAPDRSEVWLGTYGNGVFKVDPLFNQATHEVYGLMDEGAGSVALAADGIWIAGQGGRSATRGGITFASESLQEWRWLETPSHASLDGARAYDLAVRGTRAWLATDRGVVRMDTRRPDDALLWSATNGLPADDALSVAPRSDGAWVGTTRGLVFVSDSGTRKAAVARASDVGPVLASGVSVRALLLAGDTLWMATDAGLLLLPPGDSARPVRSGAARLEPRLDQPVRALALGDSEVVVAGEDAVYRIDRSSGRILPRWAAVDFGAVGGIRALASDDRSLWVVGPRGVLVVQRSTGVARLMSVPSEIAEEATDVVLSRDFAWIATRDGVVRLRRRADGSAP